MNEKISPDEVRKLLYYNPETGKIFHVSDDSEAFTYIHDNGYRRGYINRRRYYAHRVAWAIHFGAWPQKSIDHINHDRQDNRLSNLREADHKTNGRNRKLSSNNKSGFNGVGWVKRVSMWQARIKINGKLKHIGFYSDITDAVTARRRAEREHGFHENHGRKEL